MLREIQELMGLAAQLVHDSSSGKAIELDKDIIDRIDKLMPEDRQKTVLEKIEKLMKRAEGKEKRVIEKLQEIIKRAKD
jgi:hypothetical protein